MMDNYSSNTSPVQQLHPPLKSNTPLLSSWTLVADFPGRRYPLKKWTTDDADEVIEFDRARGGAGAGLGDVCSGAAEAAQEIGGRSTPVCSSCPAGLKTLESPKNDSLLFSFGGVGVLDLEGNP